MKIIVCLLMALMISLSACAGEMTVTETNWITEAVSETMTETQTQTTTITSVYPGIKVPLPTDILTIKLDSDGHQVWTDLYSLEESRIDPIAMNMDGAGNIYVTGTIYGDDWSFSTIKYDSSGRLIWVTTYNDLEKNEGIFVRGAKVDSAGNIYVTGQTSVTSAYPDYSEYRNRIVTVKYDMDGNQVWSASYQYPGSHYNAARDLELDKDGNLYIAGDYDFNEDLSSGDYLVLKYNSQGELLWDAVYSGSVYDDAPIGMVVDNQNNVYVTGKSNKDNAFYIDYLTVKYSANGDLLWATDYNGAGNRYDAPHDLAVDSSGDVYVTGESDGASGQRAFATVKYDSDGHELWAVRYEKGDEPSAMALDKDGNIYITGGGGSFSGNSYATVKYDKDGQELWAVGYKGTDWEINESRVIFVDRTGCVYVSGNCGIDGQYATIDTVKYDTNGNEVWVTKYSQIYFGDWPRGLDVDPDGNVFIVASVSAYQ